MTENISEVREAPPVAPGIKGKLQKLRNRVPQDLIPLLVLLVTIFLVLLYANDWKLWDGMLWSETTNDAYVRADVVPLSTKVSGTVSRVLINDFEQVKKGQLLVELRNDDFIAQCKQAESLYMQSQENINTIGKQIEVQTQHIESARLATLISDQDITRAVASVGSSNAALQAAKSSLEESQAQKAQAEARLRADQAVELRSQQEWQRQTQLFAVKASTQQTIEQVVADHDRDKSVVEADKEEINRLRSLIAEHAADVTKFAEELKSANATDVQSKDQLSSRKADLLAERKQLEVLSDQLNEAQSLSKARLEEWKLAQVQLDYTKIVAPVDGVLSERRAKAGHQVSAGTQVVTIVSSVPWVIASYRETQMRKIEVGDRAEIRVDALGGTVLKGKVQSLSPASEAEFALLPPDNPSGNFTKITQRVPVKIVFNPNQKLVQRVKPGMTVIAKVFTH